MANNQTFKKGDRVSKDGRKGTVTYPSKTISRVHFDDGKAMDIVAENCGVACFNRQLVKAKQQ